jgi:hypothetical protein
MVATATLAPAGGAKADSKRILGKWLSSRHGAASIFHADGSWGVQRDLDPETIQGRWWIKDNKLFLTYPEYSGVEPRSTFARPNTRSRLRAMIVL